MDSDLVTIDLQPEHFTARETVLARSGGMTAATFRYRSGVAALTITNAVGRITLLPFQGQQIWRAEFFGRPLTMQTPFEEPVDTQDFLRTYGGFFLHCGALAMGDPGAEDRHAVHGELPNARYQQAQLVIGRDAGGAFMRMTGRYRHAVAFTHDYIAEPAVTLHSESSRIHLEMRVRNLRHLPMDLMYLAHINFRPVDGAKLIDTVRAGGLRVRSALPGGLVASEEYQRLLAALDRDVASHRDIVSGAAIDPELVLALDPLPDAEGWAHGMQLLPDGAADFVSYRPAELDHCLRWMTRNPGMNALGLMLPATAEADGHAAEKAKGNLKTLAPQAEFRCGVICGALEPRAAAELRGRIERTVALGHRA